MSETTNFAGYEFRLFAPNNRAASLIGDFSDWDEIAMEKGDDGYFRVSRDLPDGTYQYRFMIRSKSWFNADDEWKTITDPYATDIDPETQNAILKLKDGQKIVDEYEWHSDDVPLPENNSIVVYEMHVGDFSGGEEDGFSRGKYTDVKAKLDYLAELGINAIELMPLKSNPGDFNWGYSPIHYFAPEPSFGTTTELKELIDECHALGIRVIVDGVYNHASTANPLTQIDHDYWFLHDGKDPEQNWGPEFDYDRIDDRFGMNPATRFVADSVRFWIYEYRIDGIRFDAAKQINNPKLLGNLVANAREAAYMKPFFTVAEFIPPTPEITEPDGPVESCWNDSFMYGVMEYLEGEPLNFEKLKDAIDPTRLGFANLTSVTNYLANHDQNRLFRKLGEAGILDEELYLRAKLGALILLTAVGVPMIWMGEEFGEHVPMSEQSNKIDWTLLQNDTNSELHEYYKRLIDFRTTDPTMRTANLDFFHEDVDSGVLCFRRYDDEGDSVVVVINLSDETVENYEIPEFPLDGELYEITTRSGITASDSRLSLDLERRTGLVFTRK